VEEAEGRGAVGNGGMAAREAGGRAGEGGGGARLEVEDGLTSGPHLSAGGRERRRGRWWSGPRGPEGLVGRGLGWVVSFFSFLFFNSISNPFKFKPFTSFQIHILTQISPTILRLFENLLNNFSTYFKFKLSFFSFF
jgi:hypothetical protein